MTILVVIGERRNGDPGSGPWTPARLAADGALDRGSVRDRLGRLGIVPELSMNVAAPGRASDPWDASGARETARRLMAYAAERAGGMLGRVDVVACGRRAQAAIGARGPELGIRDFRGDAWGGPPALVRVLMLPHPSGRCRWWNAPGAELRARLAVAQLRGATGPAA